MEETPSVMGRDNVRRGFPVECVAREIEEETSLSLAPGMFEPVVIYDGADIDGPARRFVAEFLVVNNITAGNMVIAEGSLIIVPDSEPAFVMWGTHAANGVCAHEAS